MPPFSEDLLNHPHLLTLTFDDICNEPETPEDLGNAVLFNEAMAQQIMRFVDDGKQPLLVHCTAGISRSGAVGEVLNWYFNRYLENNTADNEDFEQNNRQIQPNTLVRISTCRMKNLITVAEYPPSPIPERYIRIRELKRACIICQHWTSRRALRQDKRYIVELEHGKYLLQKECRSCKSFHKIPELRGKNMTINEKLYARMYTKTFLRKVHARYYQLPNEKLSQAINVFNSSSKHNHR